MIVIKAQVICRLPHILKMIKIKTVVTSIQSVWVTRPNRSHLKPTRACIWPIGGFWNKFCCFEATLRQYEFEFTCFRTAFCFKYISAPSYQLFCIQNLRMDLNVKICSFVKKHKNGIKQPYFFVDL